MLDAIQRFFNDQMQSTTDTEQVTEHRLQIATCALLLEAAHADDEFSPDEEKTVIKLIRDEFQLTSAEATELIALADEERRQSTDLYQFTRLIAAQFNHTEKLAVLEALWRVVYSDGRLEAHEDHLLHKLAKLLDLKHKELIALKLRVKEQSSD